MKKVHFIGIGGIGMSALARYYFSLGYKVSGSDRSNSDLIEELKKEGILVNIGEYPDLIPQDVSKVIYTIAISSSNGELIKAEGLKDVGQVDLLSYPEALGEMTNFKKVIAVCGTHGKTTTTAMTYYALKNAGVDASMIVGSLIEVNGKKTNYVYGESEWIIIEACEYRRSFLNYNPDILIVTNIDNDHLDYFENIENIKKAFQEFVDKIKESGTLITHQQESFLEAKNKIVASDQVNENEIHLQVPGIHNRKNASLVVALGELLKLDKEKIMDGLKNFKGTWRRQEYKGNFYGSEFYDDYAHHPTEIKATLQAFREKFPAKKIIAIFQPHLYSRTKLLFTDFVNSFTDADEVILEPIYAAREPNDETINSGMLVEELNKLGKKSVLVNSTEDLLEFIKNNPEKDNIYITMGAGNVYDIYHHLK